MGELRYSFPCGAGSSGLSPATLATAAGTPDAGPRNGRLLPCKLGAVTADAVVGRRN